MTARLLAALLAGAALAVSALPAAASAQDEPVELSVSAPALVRAKAPIKVSVSVSAEPGALDIAAQPLRLQVALEPECGGSYAGTQGTRLLDREIPAPAAGSAYSFTVSGEARLKPFGAQTVCAFLDDSQERQFATSTEAVVDVSKACTLASRRLAKLERRAHRVRGRAAHRRLRGQVRRAKRREHASCHPRASASSAAHSAAAAGVPSIKHLFIVVLENEDESESFGPSAPAPYLGKTLPELGAFVPNYFGVGHNSLDNYLAMISGQPPNIATQADCPVFTEMAPGVLNGEGIAIGEGCVFPAPVKTVADQLEAAGHSWHGYMQDMAASGHATCSHPAIGSKDETQAATATSQYATRHDPFVYFHSIIDSPACAKNVVDLSQLSGDLASQASTPEYSFITPDLCADGHDSTCADPSQPGGFAGINAFLQEWIPRIQSSAAYQDRGMVLVTFDESETGAEACCGEPEGPNTLNNGGTRPGPGGGKVGAVMLSPCIRPGTVSDYDYNHYSMLRWVEDNFGLSHLANAAPQAAGAFGPDILNRSDCDQGMRLSVSPRHAPAGVRRTFHFTVKADLPLCRQGTTIRFAGRRVKTNGRGMAKIRAKLHGHRATATAISTVCEKPAKAKVRVRGG